MSDSIIVRVTLDSYDIVHPREKQTQVYVQIPEVARASWLLPEDHFHFSKNGPWPNVVDSAQEWYAQGSAVTDSASSAARAAIVEWLRDDANRDEMQVAWELDHARRDPVARRLLEENERLRAQVAELERELGWATAERDGLLNRVAELEGVAAAGFLTSWTNKLDLKSLDNFLIELGRATDHEPMDGAPAEIEATVAQWRELAESQDATAPDPVAYGPSGYRCGCGKDAHSNLTPCQDERADADNAAPGSDAPGGGE